MKFKNLMLALAVTMMMASCGEKKEGEVKEGEATEATATEAPKEEAAPEADAKTMITKAWKLEAIDVTEEGLSKIPKDKQAEMKKMMDEMVTKMKDKTTYDFKADGKVSLEYMSFDDKFKKEDGTWSLSDDGKKLSITGADGKKQELTVVTLSESNLDFEMEGMVMKLIPKK